MKNASILYRCTVEEDKRTKGKRKVVVLAFPVVKVTTCFYYLKEGRGLKQVGKGSKKPFAHPSVELALNAFIKEQRQVQSEARKRVHKSQELIERASSIKEGYTNGLRNCMEF